MFACHYAVKGAKLYSEVSFPYFKSCQSLLLRGRLWSRMEHHGLIQVALLSYDYQQASRKRLFLRLAISYELKWFLRSPSFLILCFSTTTKILYQASFALPQLYIEEKGLKNSYWLYSTTGRGSGVLVSPSLPHFHKVAFSDEELCLPSYWLLFSNSSPAIFIES